MPLLVAIFLLLLLPGARADDGCLAQARDAYERLYCKVKQGGEGAGLPSLADFRRNTPQTQALLLRRAAQRLELTLPEAPRRSPSEPAKPEAPNGSGAEPQKEASQTGLAGCRLEGTVIRCEAGGFRLVPNRPNNQLRPEALSAENTLDLPAYTGSAEDEVALRRYLLDAYEAYIGKMLSIGLGGSTMSFSRFYYTWHQVRGQGGDFPERMATMFTYLKRDKTSMTVQARYTEATPDSLDRCGRLSRRLIVCDQAESNWVYEGR